MDGFLDAMIQVAIFVFLLAISLAGFDKFRDTLIRKKIIKKFSNDDDSMTHLVVATLVLICLAITSQLSKLLL